MSTLSDHLATASRFAIAGAIVYFAYQLAQIGNQVLSVTESLDRVTKHIDPTLHEIREIRVEITEVRKLIPEILEEVAEVRRHFPIIVDEVGEVRKSIPPILTRISSVEKQIPPLLKRVDEALAVVGEIQQQIPQIVATADRAIATLDQTREEMVPLVLQALQEIRLTRDSVELTLNRVEDLVEDAYFKATDAIGAAQEVGQEASEGVVKGIFTGLIKLPFQLVGTLASPIVKTIGQDVLKQLTEKDIELMATAGNLLFESGDINREQHWENPNSGNSGSITILRIIDHQGIDCVEGRLKISNKRRQLHDRIDEYCLNDKDEWILASDLDK